VGNNEAKRNEANSLSIEFREGRKIDMKAQDRYTGIHLALGQMRFFETIFRFVSKRHVFWQRQPSQPGFCCCTVAYFLGALGSQLLVD
jgi:hypothetical protein